MGSACRFSSCATKPIKCDCDCVFIKWSYDNFLVHWSNAFVCAWIPEMGLDAPFAFVIIIFIVIYFSCVSRVCHKNDQVWLAERGRDENNLNWERWIAPIRKPYQKNISWKILYAVLSHTWSLFLLHCNQRHSLNLNSFDDAEYFQTFRFSFKNKLNTFLASK